MIFRNQYQETVTVVLAIVMGFLMSLASIVVDHLDFHFSNVFRNWSMITMVILLVSICMPYKAWSARFTRALGCKEGTLSWKLVDNLLPSVILNTCNTVIVSAANILYSETIPAGLQMSHWTSGMVHDWPITFVLSYFIAFIAEAAGVYVANRTAAALT